MSAGAIPNFDEFVKKEKPTTVKVDAVPDFDEFLKQNPNWESRPDVKFSPTQRFFGTLAEEGAGLFPALKAARHPIETLKSLAHTKLTDIPDALDAEAQRDPGAALAHVTELGLPLFLKGAGRLISAPAEPLAESSLGIRGVTKAYGATPGKAILEETSGIRPSSVEASARGKLIDLNQELENLAAHSNQTASLAPAKRVLSRASSEAASANSEQTPREIAKMSEQLTNPRPGFSGATTYPQGANTPISFKVPQSSVLGPNGQPIPGKPIVTPGKTPLPIVSENQPAPQFLGMKRQFDQDFIRNWSPTANTKHGLGVARQAYGAMADEFNRAVPGAEPINQNIQSLIPVAERARMTDLSAGPMERTLNRVARPTGALFPMLFGYHEGGIPGMLTTIAGQEAFSAPTMKMLGARGLFGARKALGAAGEASKPLLFAPRER